MVEEDGKPARRNGTNKCEGHVRPLIVFSSSDLTSEGGGTMTPFPGRMLTQMMTITQLGQIITHCSGAADG
jgi:hypothetical protein